jgi:hypothetical protein
MRFQVKFPVKPDEFIDGMVEADYAEIRDGILRFMVRKENCPDYIFAAAFSTWVFFSRVGDPMPPEEPKEKCANCPEEQCEVL